MAENSKAMLLFLSEIYTMIGSCTTSSVFEVCTRARLVCEKVVWTKPDQPDRLLRPCKVAKHHADACTPTDLYQRVGGSSEPPEPPSVRA